MTSRLSSIEMFAGNGDLSGLEQLFEGGYSQLEINLALENAIAYSQNSIAQYLLSHGAEFSSNNYQGVYYAVHNNELEGLRFGIANGVDINVNDGMLLNAAIETAINTKDIQIVSWLLLNGANAELLTAQSRALASEYGSDQLKRIIRTGE